MPVISEPGKTKKERVLKFVLPIDVHDGTVSVVGNFNDWVPGTHVLRKRSNNTRSVKIKVPVGTPVYFRYLGEGGRWFDDPEAGDQIEVRN